MRLIISYIRQYFYEINKPILVLVSLFTGFLVYVNYYYGVDDSISHSSSFPTAFISRYIIFLTAFAVPYLLYSFYKKEKYIYHPQFAILLLIAPAIFSVKTSLSISANILDGNNQNDYWNHVIYWPFHFIIISSILFVIWRLVDKDQPFYGIKSVGINWKPYLIMLLIMLPLIAAASTQPDFLAMYPKLKSVTENGGAEIAWWQKLLFELSYGTDFISIELFFRGFLILAFIKWAGKDAILPMACFYCTIHFGKPLAECISSYFGGIILGVVVYHTRSILGGLIVHLGIAWMMEVGGYISLLVLRP
jgi:hypothetical protein